MARKIIPCLIALLFTLPAQAAEFSYRSGPAEMRVDVVTPKGGATKRLVLVLHTSGGHTEADGDYAKRLVAEGYATAVPHFLDAYGITPQQRRRTWTQYRDKLFADFGRIADEVADRLKVQRGTVSAVGFSNGGYWAAYLAGKGILHKGVAYYAAVTEAGNDLEVQNLSAAINGKGGGVLFLHGTDDGTVNVRAVRRLEKQVGRSATFVYYEGADHRFDRDSGAANDKAAIDAWKRALDFLSK